MLDKENIQKLIAEIKSGNYSNISNGLMSAVKSAIETHEQNNSHIWNIINYEEYCKILNGKFTEYNADSTANCSIFKFYKCAKCGVTAQNDDLEDYTSICIDEDINNKLSCNERRLKTILE